MNAIQSCLERFDVNPNQLVEFNAEEDSSHLRYATIVQAQKRHHAYAVPIQGHPIGLVKSVYEHEFSPLMYLVDGTEQPDKSQLTILRNILAMRGDAPFLGVVKGDNLDIYPIKLGKTNIVDIKFNWKDWKKDDISLFSFLSRRLDNSNFQTNWIANVIHNLMLESMNALRKSGEVNWEESISLVGRALFARFIADRDMFTEEILGMSKPSDLFDNRKNAERTSHWLDETFNGDLLPIQNSVFSKLTETSYQTLGNVLRKTVDGRMFLGWEQKWEHLDFAHVPVGILSQVYESLLRENFPTRQRSQSTYFTPSEVVNLMVRAAIEGVKLQADPKKLKILDPSAGAGVFLITAFRELVAERWREDGKRPNTKTLRSILNNQIRGFDVDESALRLAALGLHLISIELDSNPKNNLKFDNLIGTVLHHPDSHTKVENANMGSLNPEFGSSHKEKYDIVIGNPPWNNNLNFSDWSVVKKHICQFANKRTGDDSSIEIPHSSIDLAFLWRSMEWAKPGGQIALVLHARWLFHQGSKMPDTRDSIFKALKVNSIVNCTNLRNSKFWSGMSAPFCLVFACNQVPDPVSLFRFVNPIVAKSMSDAGSLQYDSSVSPQVSTSRVRQFPTILKVLSSGSMEDCGILERIQSRSLPTLASFWRQVVEENFGKSEHHRTGTGYRPYSLAELQKIENEGTANKRSISNSRELEITKENFGTLLITESDLGQHSKANVKLPRNPGIFKGPLLAVDCKPSKELLQINASVCEGDAKFKKDIYGYSMRGISEGDLLARFLCLILRSRFAMWQILLSSGKYGVERSSFEKFELDGLIVPDFRELTKSQKEEAVGLFNQLNSGEEKIEAVDDWVSHLYGVGKEGLAVIADTLEFNAPYAENMRKAEQLPSNREIDEFCRTLELQLTPMAEHVKKQVSVKRVKSCSKLPWQCLDVSFFDGRSQIAPSECDFKEFSKTVNSTMSNEFLQRYGKNGLLVGRFTQRRNWNFTHVKLLSKKIARSDLDVFKSGQLSMGINEMDHRFGLKWSHYGWYIPNWEWGREFPIFPHGN